MSWSASICLFSCSFTYSFARSSIQEILEAFYLLVTILSASTQQQRKQESCPQGAYILVGQSVAVSKVRYKVCQLGLKCLEVNEVAVVGNRK